MCERFTLSQHFHKNNVNCDQMKLQLKIPQRNRRKNRLNVVQQLTSREISANEHFPHSFVTKKPLKTFKLGKMVNEMGKGQVFLGFTKNGQFVVSYSLQMGADDVMFPVYNYKLYWWHFVPNQPLKLISEVRLFGEHEISQDLHILVCQWPTDETKIIVYGFYRNTEWIDQQYQQCYITITAAPSLEFCQNCSEKKLCLCLEHSFIIHTQYHAASPFPEFVPTICLKIDGTVVINTGDSLLAISVHLNNIDSKSIVGNNEIDTAFCIQSENSNKEETDSNNERLSTDLEAESVNCDIHSSVLNEQEYKVFSNDDGVGSNANEASTSQDESCKDEYLFVTETDEDSAKENISPHNCSMSDTEESVKCQKDKAIEVKKDGVFSTIVNMSNALNFLSCVTCVKRIFVENSNPISFDEDEDLCNNGYNNCLPLEVRGSNYQEMRCIPHNRRSMMIKESVVIEQRTFDVEQFVHEVSNRLCSSSGKKYLAVDDYDIQIIDVDPETGDVTGLAFVLIKASSNQLNFRYTSNFYQTKLIFAWNIFTGENRLVMLLYFTEKTAVSTAKEHSYSNSSQMHRIHYQLQRIMENVPKPEMKSVKVLSNLPALKGTSLPSIVSPYHHIALVL